MAMAGETGGRAWPICARSPLSAQTLAATRLVSPGGQENEKTSPA